MIKNTYSALVTNLTSLIERQKELKDIYESAEYDLKWRLSLLYKDVVREHEQKFINLSGMQNILLTTEQKEIERKKEEEVSTESNKENHVSEMIEDSFKENVDKKWAKNLYRRSVKRCHPDITKVKDDSYKEKLTEIYKKIVDSYDNACYDILMVESYKLLILPDIIINDQITILNESILDYKKKIESLTYSQPVVWHYFDDSMKENFLINFMKEKGVKFVDKTKVKEVLKRRVPNRKPGQRPKNNLKLRAKNKSK